MKPLEQQIEEAKDLVRELEAKLDVRTIFRPEKGQRAWMVGQVSGQGDFGVSYVGDALSYTKHAFRTLDSAWGFAEALNTYMALRAHPYAVPFVYGEKNKMIGINDVNVFIYTKPYEPSMLGCYSDPEQVIKDIGANRIRDLAEIVAGVRKRAN